MKEVSKSEIQKPNVTWFPALTICKRSEETQDYFKALPSIYYFVTLWPVYR